MMSEQYAVLNTSLTVLSLKLPLPTVLNGFIRKSRSAIKEYEAWALLKYLLQCGGFDPNLKYVGVVMWSSSLQEDKSTVEKYKRGLMKALKDINTKEHGLELPKLKQADLKLPNHKMFWQTCLALADYALSYQLNCLGIEFNTPTPSGSPTKLLSFEEQKEGLLKETELLQNKISAEEAEVNGMSDKLIKCCPEVHQKGLESAATRTETISKWESENDSLLTTRKEHEYALETLLESIKSTKELVEGQHKKASIDGQKWSVLNSPETSHSLENDGFQHRLSALEMHLRTRIALFRAMDMEGATDIIDKWNPELIKNMYRLPIANRLEELENTLQSHIDRIKVDNEVIRNSMVKQDKEKVETWFENFMPSIPLVDLIIDSPMKSSVREPFIDTDKLDSLVAVKEFTLNKNENIMSKIPISTSVFSSTKSDSPGASNFINDVKDSSTPKSLSSPVSHHEQISMVSFNFCDISEEGGSFLQRTMDASLLQKLSDVCESSSGSVNFDFSNME